MSGKTDAARERPNEKADVARRILELSGTIAEAIGYMRAGFELPDGDLGGYAGIIKDIGEGLISLDGAASSLLSSPDTDPEDPIRLARSYDELTSRLDTLVDAFLGGRAADLAALGSAFDESFTAYCADLSGCFRGASIM